MATSRRRAAVADAQMLVRALEDQDNHQGSSTSSSVSELALQELEGLSAGQVADLVQLQRDQQNQQSLPQPKDIATYEKPLDPFLFHIQQERAPVEPGRLDSRVRSLQQHLADIYQPPKLDPNH